MAGATQEERREGWEVGVSECERGGDVRWDCVRRVRDVSSAKEGCERTVRWKRKARGM